MKSIIALCVCFGLAIVLVGCDGGPAVTPDLADQERALEAGPVDENGLTAEELSILNEMGSFASKAGSAVSRAPVYTVDGLRPVGSSVLIRDGNRILALLNSTLDPGTAVTLWWVIFNAPENCTDNECGEDDLTNAEARVDIVYADGRIILPVLERHSWRDSYFFSGRSVGDASGSIVPVVFGAEAPGLEDAQAAEVHLVVHTHGRAIPSMEDEMTSTYSAGCQGFPEELGTPGPNTCKDIQFAIHKAQGVTVDRTEVQVFDPAGDYGGGILTPGTFFPPTQGSHSTLRRGTDWVSYNLHTTGLPAGAYTNWWVIFNNPAGCIDGCDVEDLFNDTNPSVFWAAGGVVQENGVGNYRAKIREGEVTGELALGNPAGLVDARGAEIHLIIKYHGPASDDPDVLYEQTHTLLGSCEEGANAWDFGPPFGVQCFDPQVAVHKP